MRHVFGPVPSRRLGFSLGLDLVPFKTCTLDCVYCQLGRTTRKTIRRRPYIAAVAILRDLREALARGQRIDYVTLSGSGEPTLHSKIGSIIDEIKRFTQIPVAVLTNGTLLTATSLRKELFSADLVIPSLDAVSQGVFEKVNRPHPSLRIDRIIEGLKAFRMEFSGQVWMEVMLVKGINDTVEAISSLRKTVSGLACEKIQLNTPVRPPSEPYARSLGFDELSRIKEALGGRCEIVSRFHRRDQKAYWKDVEQQILTLLERRPMRVREISDATGLHENEVVKYLQILSESGRVRAKSFGGSMYYHR